MVTQQIDKDRSDGKEAESARYASLLQRRETTDIAMARQFAELWRAALAVRESGSGVEVFDPAEEARRQRRVVRAVEARGGSGEAAARQWRAMMGEHLAHAQAGPIALAGGGEVEMSELARHYFGTAISLDFLTSPRALLLRLAHSPGAIGCLRWPGDSGPGRWWATLHETACHAIHIVAGWPMGAPKIAILASQQLAGSGDDVTIAIAHDDLCIADRVLQANDLSGQVVARLRSLALIGFDGFVDESDPRLARARSDGLEGLRLVGVAQNP